MRDKPRLYIENQLGKDLEFNLNKDQIHYLIKVIRLNEGDEFFAFNGNDGEWSCELKDIAKKAGLALCINQIRPQENLPNLSLWFAPIKGHRNDNIIEKATEIGAVNIQPIITERTIVRKANIDKYISNAIEAAEQCERLSIPKINELQPLDNILSKVSDDTIILFADETMNGSAIEDAIENQPKNLILLIGPEGGFSALEREFIISHKFVKPIRLGTRILRADTAAITGLALAQKAWGDWK